MLRRAALAAASLLLLSFAPAQYFGRQQDEVLYLVASQALASGRYCHLLAPGCPPLVSATPGFPLLLAPLSLFTEDPRAFQLLAALLGALVPWAAWWWLRRRLDENAALLGALLAGTSPLLLSQAGLPMTETPYLLLCLLFLAAVEDGKPAGAGGLWLALTQLRPAGLSLAPALWRWRRDPAKLARAALPAALGALAWSLWSRAASGSVQESAELRAAYDGHWARLPSVMLDNVLSLLGALGGSHLPPSLAYGPLAVLLGAAVAGGAGWGVWLLLRRRQDDAGAWALLGALAMHLVWPWHYERYLIPLLPLLWRAAAEKLGKRAVPVLGALLAAQLAFQTLPRWGRESPWATPELSAEYAWLREQPGAWTLASALPLRDGWWSRRPAVSFPDASDPDVFVASLKARKVRYALYQEDMDLGFSDPGRADALGALSLVRKTLSDPARFRPVAPRIYEVR